MQDSSPHTANASAANASGYDVERIRVDFPILFREVYGKPLVYLDNGASAQKPRPVLDAIEYAYKMEYANVHRGLHYLSNTATAKFEEARETVRRFLNAGSTDEIIFTRSSTEAINLVAASYGGMKIGPADEIVLSIMEHHSNIVPWHFHRERRGAVLKWAPISDTGEFLIDEFERLLTPKTKIVAITHMSNVLGTIVPVKQVCEIAHARGIPVVVDGSQGALHDPSGSGGIAFGSPSFAQLNSPVGARFRGVVDPVGYRVLHIAGCVGVERVQDWLAEFRLLLQGGNVRRPDASRPERFAGEPAHPFRGVARPTGE